MAHLTLGELTSVIQQVQDHRNGMRLAQLRAMPGYGEDLLSRYKDVLPPGLYRSEVHRLRASEDAVLRGQYRAEAWTDLSRAYRDDDLNTVSRWESAMAAANARQAMRAEQARARALRARGMAGLGGLG